MKEGPFYPDHGLERIVAYHERQDARFASRRVRQAEREIRAGEGGVQAQAGVGGFNARQLLRRSAAPWHARERCSRRCVVPRPSSRRQSRCSRIARLGPAAGRSGGLCGGGANPLPGEISLAHNGVLFLDELPEFKRQVLEVLRQPLEEGAITIARARQSARYPARFMLVASMNPCPCGHLNDPGRACVCSPPHVQRYLAKISGPLLDRIDLHVEVTPVPFDDLQGRRAAEPSAAVRARVVRSTVAQVLSKTEPAEK